MNSIRNNTVDVIRGFAMLLVVLGHTLSGSTCEFHDNLLFQIIWTLQMPLFIIISGYVTKYSQPITSARGLLKFIKKRTIAYLLPWTVWTFIVRGLIFMKDGLLDIKYLLWNMDSGYWFLVTIWTISIVYGCSDYLSNRISKKDNVLVLFHIAWCTVGMGILGLVGFTMGLSFLCIKLTLYYIPFYLAGYLYGHYQEYILKLHNGRNYINYIVALCLALWLSLINRIDFYNIPDSGIIIALRAATSLVGCVAVIGLFTSFCSKIVGGGNSTMVGCTFIGDLSNTLFVSESNQDGNHSNDAVVRRNNGSDIKLCTGINTYRGNNKAITIQWCSKLYALCKDNAFQCLKWAGENSLQIYLVHGFSLCLLVSKMQIAANQFPVNAFIAINFIITVALSCLYIKIIGLNRIINKILFWK